MATLKLFEDRLSGLISSLSPAGRRLMSIDIAKKLRTRQQRRIKAQTAPDGSPFIPRKHQPVRGKRNRIKREMFAKLRTNRYMKASGDASAATVEFTSRVQRIARVHQFGLKDRPARDKDVVEYPKRELIGFSVESISEVESLLIKALSKV